MSLAKISGKHILVTGGSSKENIDGVRHYTNRSRPEDHGHLVATSLVNAGARVTLITLKTRVPPPAGVMVISSLPGGAPIFSAEDLRKACEIYCDSRLPDGIVHLAVLSSLRPFIQSQQKLKVKKEPGAMVVMEVVANTNIFSALSVRYPSVFQVGYDERQNFRGGEDGDLFWKTLIETHRHTHRVVVGCARDPQPRQDLAHKKIVVSSGPVMEIITDSGDVITNFSSGRQGHEIACALADRGADVVLIAGPVLLPDPLHLNIRTIHVQSTQEMLLACLNEGAVDAYVGVAAVADFSVEKPIDSTSLCGVVGIPFIQNPDILATLGKSSDFRPGMVIGFAAETTDLIRYAQEKLKAKGADAVFANQVGVELITRDSNKNHVHRVTRDDVYDLGEIEKYQVGLRIADLIVCRHPSLIGASEGHRNLSLPAN